LFFRGAGCCILVFAWSECLSYLTVFTVISCWYFRNYIVSICHVLSLLCFAKLKKTGFRIYMCFHSFICPNPFVAVETNCKHKRIIYLTACVLWSPAISCEGCEIYLWIKMIIVNQMSILKWRVMPEKKILTYIYVHSSYP
jgi:hypothetical protein